MNALSAVPVVRRRIPRLALRVSAILVAVAWGLALQADPVRAQIDAWIDPGHGGHDPGALGVNGCAFQISVRVASVAIAEQ